MFGKGYFNKNCLGGVIVGMLICSVVDRGIESRSSQTKDSMKLVVVAYRLCTQH